MENELDKIEEGKEAWTKAMKRFYTPFSRDLKKAAKEMRDVKRQEADGHRLRKVRRHDGGEVGS